ncbi:MAG: LacI family DNA-binding transcriptional regulator [Bacillota bacterium]
MKVTMKDIAEEAGVSKATVSRVINNDSYVSADTRKKVMKLVKKYNYKPHTVAQGLARDLSHTLGLMIPGPPRDITDPFFLEFLHGVGNKAAEYNYSLSLPTVSEKDKKELYDEGINFNQLDGVVIVNPEVDDFRVEYFQEVGLPFVFLGRLLSGNDDVCWVDGDNLGGAYQATAYLIEQGHEQIACITGPDEFVASRIRLQGYQDALADHNMDCREDLIIHGGFTRESGYQKMQELLKRDISFSAVFVVSDSMAIGAIRALKEAGVAVPEECAVMGFDGIDLGAYTEPSLTTVRQPAYELGEEAVESLIKLINGEDDFEMHKVLDLELLIRDSV